MRLSSFTIKWETTFVYWFYTKRYPTVSLRNETRNSGPDENVGKGSEKSVMGSSDTQHTLELDDNKCWAHNVQYSVVRFGKLYYNPQL